MKCEAVPVSSLAKPHCAIQISGRLAGNLGSLKYSCMCTDGPYTLHSHSHSHSNTGKEGVRRSARG